MTDDKHVWRSNRVGHQKIPLVRASEKKKCKDCQQDVKPLPSGNLPRHAVPLNKSGRWHWCKNANDKGR